MVFSAWWYLAGLVRVRRSGSFVGGVAPPPHRGNSKIEVGVKGRRLGDGKGSSTAR